MSGAASFKYPLAPVLLARQWAHDAGLAELADRNARVAAQERGVADLAAQLAAASEHWSDLMHGTRGLALERLAILSRYGSDLAARLEQARATLTACEEQREAARDQVMQSRRSLDALERHRDELEDGFIQARLTADFKVADDNWNTRKKGQGA